jgi:ABC-type multidrug transport system fused ATPase/permease subunit
LNASSTPKVGE